MFRISLAFTYAPLPLSEGLTPLAHAAALARRRYLENPGLPPRHRIAPAPKKAPAVASAN